ncbi:LPS export ABC transporter periplasmic protein LptC [Candidatus Caldatribacterium saccharofermentans]|uniref:LPS export ABC transporter periplasmic protein LptC n=1 Tax=Candidatus Caldatribacterium saccharofermentans TaxID=1454753 RepID=UPI003D0474DB
MVPKSDSRGVLLFLGSLALLGLLVGYFFVIPHPVTLQEPPVEEKRTTIFLEEAEVTKVGARGREWTLRAPHIEKQGDTVVLSSIVGTFFREGTPLYEVRALRGRVLLGTQSVFLEGVELRHVTTGEQFFGQALSWQGEREEFTVAGVRFVGRGVRAECNELVYNVAEKKAYLRGNVVVRLEMGKP